MKLFPAFLLAAIAVAQTASNHLPGTVTAVNPSANQISVKTAQGDLTFTTSDRTQILRAQAGVSDPKQWPKMTLAEIAPGDEVVAYYRGAVDQKPLVATSLVVRTKADFGQLAQKQLEDWKKRGRSGTVTAVDPAAKTITMKSGQRTVTVQADDKTNVRRYSPDSAKPEDAKPSTLAEIQVGDQVNVLGQPQRRRRNHPGRDDLRRHLPPDRGADQLDRSRDRRDEGHRPRHQEAADRPRDSRFHYEKTAGTDGAGAGQALSGRTRRRAVGRRSWRRRPSGEGRGGDIGQMLDRLPSIQLADLKPKDAIMVSTTTGTDPGKVTAVMLLAGVEPVLTAAPTATRDIMSGWNLGGGGEAQ